MRDTFRMAVSILTAAERRRALLVCIPIVIAALASALTIASVIPFLSVLSDPRLLQGNGVIAQAYRWTGISSEYRFIALLGAAAVAIIAFSSVANIWRVHATWKLTANLIHTVSCRLLAVYLRQPYEFFIRSHSGDMATSVLSECEQLVMQVYKPTADLVASALTVAAILSVVIAMNPLIAVSAIVFLGTVYAVTFGYSRRRVALLGKIRVQANNERYRIAGEALNGIKDVKILGREAHYLRRFEDPSTRIADGRTRANVIGEAPKYVVEAASLGGIVLICLLVLDPRLLASQQNTSDIIPLLGIFAFAAQRLIPELQRTYAALNKLQYGAAAVGQVYRDLQKEPELPPLVHQTPQPLPFRQEVCAKHVHHRYEQAERSSLVDLSFCVQRGERVGIVGGSGAGKTTLADLLLGLLKLESGALTVDGVELTDQNIRSWQQTVGYVPQDIFISDASVAENIALGIASAEIDMDKVRRSADVANLTGVIEKDLPEGFQTRLGEKGVRMSGGQRQRIGIARALYHDADLIIFDEATSALDNVTEAEVVDAINQLPGTKTVLIIAHRLSTVRHCDRIMVLDRGRLSAFGTWEELLAGNAIFQELVSRTGKSPQEAAEAPSAV